MKALRERSAAGEGLRARAEKLLGKTSRQVAEMSVEDVQKLVHELQVHQIELEMQNDELRRTQLELETTRDSYSDLFDFAPTAFLNLDARGVIEAANLAAGNLLGLERRDLIKEKFTRFIAAEAQDDFYLYQRRLLNSKKKSACELNLVSAKGESLTVQMQGIVMEDPRPGQTQWRLTLNDITERKQAEEELRRSEDRYRTLVEQASDGLFVTDARASRLLEVNSACHHMTGYSREELLKMSVMDMVVPEDVPRIASEIAKLASGKNVFSEWRVRRKDGTQFPGEITARQTPSGRIQGFIRDITARKEAEEAVRRSEHHLSNFFDHAPIGLVWLAASGTILRANQAELDMLGFSAKGYLGHFFTEFCVSVTDGIELLKRLAARETVRNYRLVRRCKDGSIQHMLADAVSFWMEGQFQYSAVFMRDITYRVNLEREVLHVSEWEHRRIAQDLHDGLGQLLVGTVHLTSALQKELPAKSLSSACQLQRIVKLLNEAVAQTRSLARGLHPVEQEGNGLMVALEALARRTHSLFQVACRFQYPRPVLIRDNAVATHLYRIAQEAITNAVKHAKPKRIAISLTETAGRINLVIRDDGTGLPAHRQKEPGMGLRIMRYRAGMIGGALTIQKADSRGTAVTCSVRLPIVSACSPPAPSRKRKK